MARLTDKFPGACDLQGRQIIVGVCGGIAAYKTAELVSRLVQRGAGVTVVMTEAATRFVGPLTFQALSGRPVRSSLWDLPDSSDPRHIAATEQADLMVVAPATADMLAKVASGICDDLLSTMVCAAACPVVFCPGMNWRMWEHPATRRNVQKLKRMGYSMIGPEEGWLACRQIGMGRMSEPETILQQVLHMLSGQKAGQGEVRQLAPGRASRRRGRRPGHP